MDKNSLTADTRWHLLDTLRGYTLINMVLFHFLYDVFIVYGYSPGWNFRSLPYLWQQSICWSFILISGIVFHFSRSHLRRGLLLNGWGFVITAVTVLVMPSETIWFGVLNLIGISILLAGLLSPMLSRIPPAAGMAASFLCFLLTRPVSRGYLGLESLFLVPLPPWLYRWFVGAWLGFAPADFLSSDYFPVFPWYFLFLTGYYLFYFLKKEPIVRVMKKGPVPFLSALGRKTLWIYLLHQPVCMLLCMLIFQH